MTTERREATARETGVRARVAGVGSAVPGAFGQKELWDEFFARHYSNNRLARMIFRRAGVENRHCVIDHREEDASEWSTGARMKRFAAEAVPLGREAVEAALADAGLRPADVGQLVVASCTGYLGPGLDILLAAELGMPTDVARVHIGHMGCYAALPALTTGSDAVLARGRTAVVVCLELTSLHLQPVTGDVASDREQMVSHALFGDAAAAFVLVPDDDGAPVDGDPAPGGFEVVGFANETDSASQPLMSWDITDLGFKMGLAASVPRAVGTHVRGLVEGILGEHGLGVEDVGAWAVHPGGPEILDVVAEKLELSEEQMAPSRGVLRDFGNCSSATVMLILERILAAGLPPGSPVVAMAFGPGLTASAVLLRAKG